MKVIYIGFRSRRLLRFHRCPKFNHGIRSILRRFKVKYHKIILELLLFGEAHTIPYNGRLELLTPEHGSFQMLKQHPGYRVWTHPPYDVTYIPVAEA